MGAVLADVVEGAQRAVLITHHCDGVAGDIDCGIAAGFAYLFDMAHPLPTLGEDLLLIEAEPLRFYIGLGAQRLGNERVRIVTLLD